MELQPMVSGARRLRRERAAVPGRRGRRGTAQGGGAADRGTGDGACGAGYVG
jgi:hypothetical protein